MNRVQMYNFTRRFKKIFYLSASFLALFVSVMNAADILGIYHMQGYEPNTYNVFVGVAASIIFIIKFSKVDDFKP